MSTIKLADYVSSFIVQQGIRHIFTLSGGGSIQLLDAVGRQEGLEYVCNHHEQAASIAAEAYSRVSGNLGACLVTMGPGSTNAVTGVTCAWLDSIPVMYFSGQVAMDHMMTGTGLRNLGVQEINIVDIVKPITKYVVVVDDAKKIKYHLEKAAFLAKTGRPGPVWLDIPLNIQNSQIEEASLENFDPVAEGLMPHKDTDKLKQQVSEVLEMVRSAKRPLIFAGHGIHLAKGQQDFLEAVGALNIPIVTSMSAHDLLPSDHELFAGRPGIFGDRAGNFATQTCDLLIVVGARMHLWNIGYNYKDFARNAKKVVVDIDPEELKKKTTVPNYPVQADAKEFLVELTSQAKKMTLPDISSWRNRCLEIRNKYPVILPEYGQQKDSINSYYFVGQLSEAMREGEVIFTGVGTSFTGTLQSIKIKKGQKFNCSVGCAPMGYDLPAAIGACFANNKKRVVLIVGEGGMMLNLQELQTISHYNLPIKIFMLNNNEYLAIKNTQNSLFNGRYTASEETSGVTFPDFKKVADSFSIPYEHMLDNNELNQKLNAVLDSEGPVLCDVNMQRNQPLIPRFYAEVRPDGTYDARPLEDMYPFIDRENYKRYTTLD